MLEDGLYEQLVNQLLKEKINDGSKIVDTRTRLIENDNNIIEDMGVYIDIFPIFKLPNNENEMKKYFKKIYRLSKMQARNEMLKKYYLSNSIKKRIQKIVFFFPEHLYYLLFKKNKGLKDEILKLMEQYSKNVDSKYEGYILSIYGKKEIMRKEVYERTTKLEFEGEYFSVPTLYEEYLSNLYGNYMELPPIKKRVSHHNYVAFWK